MFFFLSGNVFIVIGITKSRTRIFRNTDKTVYCTTPETYGTISRTKYRITVFRNIFGNLSYGFRRVQIIDKQRPAPFDTRIIPVF